MGEIKKNNGWAMPTKWFSCEFHFFEEGYAVCGKGRLPENQNIEHQNDLHPHNCQKCQQLAVAARRMSDIYIVQGRAEMLDDLRVYRVCDYCEFENEEIIYLG